MNYVTLNNGVKMPQLGFGCFQITDYDKCKEVVLNALDMGYRLIDTAALYENEGAVGAAIRESGIPREDIFITTKILARDTREDKVKDAFNRSIENLGLDYIDLYLIHQPFNDSYGAWRTMSELYRAGRCRAIGVSNFFPDKFVDFCFNNEVIPAVNQFEVHPFFQNELLCRLTKQYNVQLEAWGPLAENRNGIFQNPVLAGIAEKHEKTIAQVILRWHMQRGIVAIPKSTRKERMIENISVFDFELDVFDMLKIESLETGKSVDGDYRDPECAYMMNALGF